MAENITNPISNQTSNPRVTTNSAGTKDNATIDEAGFMNLFVESLKNQDPLEPMSNGEMMQQITQLNQMQNTLNMKEILEDLSSSIKGQNPIGDYLDLIGKKVKVETEEGYKEGEVLSVGKDGDDIVFEFENGEAYYVSQIVGASEI